MTLDSFDGIDGVPSAQRSTVKEYINRVNFAVLERLANRCRALAADGEQSAVVPECSIDPSRFSLGRCNIVFEVRFPDGFVCVARVCTNHFRVLGGEENTITEFFRSEVETMQYISDKTNIPIPKVLGYDSDPHNAVNFRFILMEALPGRPLGVPYHHIPHANRAHFLGQLADYLVQLGSLSFSSIGCLRYDREEGSTTIVPQPGTSSIYNSSREFVHAIRCQQNELLIADETFPSKREDRELASKILSHAALKAIRPQFLTGPFPLAHPDLHYNNILVDANYNITGIIDWSGVTTVPQEVFASVPGFRIPPGIAVEEIERYTGCLELFVRAVRGRESELVHQGDWLVISDFLGSDSAECLNKGLEQDMPWRGIAYARYLLPLVFGEGMTWDELLGKDLVDVDGEDQ
jgi:hypothetical protein